MAKNKDKLGTRGTPIKSNITDNDSAWAFFAPAKTTFPTSMSVMTTSKGTIQGNNGIAIADDKHQVIVQAKTWGSVNEQQTLTPSVNALKKQLEDIGKPAPFTGVKFTADSGFNSKSNLNAMAQTELDCYIADPGYRSRNPLFQNSATYQKSQAKRHKARQKSSTKYFTKEDFTYDLSKLICICPAGNPMWVQSKTTVRCGEEGVSFCGYLAHCRTCEKQSQCMRKPPKKTGRQLFVTQENTDETQNYYQQMKDKIDTSQGRKEYSKRLGCIEPVYGNITVNKGMNRFTLRGQTKVDAQWQTYCLVHNIEKLRQCFS